MKRNLLLVVALTLALSASAATAATLTILSPAGPILPGATAGFGYELVNDDALQYFSPTSLSIQVAGGGFITELFDYPTLAPEETLTRPYNSGTQTGLLKLTFPLGTAPGDYLLEVLLFGDLLSSPTAPGGTAVELEDSVLVTVSDPGIVIPEPSTALLAGVALVAGLVVRRRRAA